MFVALWRQDDDQGVPGCTRVFANQANEQENPQTMLTIYNNLTRKKEPFTPIEAGRARMYVCGMTVYDYCHIGHARVMVVFDVVARYLRFSGYDLVYVRNITDIDDKIINRANSLGQSCDDLTRRFIDAMHEDERSLNVLAPDQEPRATRSVELIVNMIRKLIERGYAYIGSNGDVFYSVAQFDGYGRLSGKNPDELRAGERVEIDRAKRDPLDFVLWKMVKPGEPAWPSPWGPGRPGWHIECSAMSTDCLGNHFDIHGGGMDLQFPHHENEIAQSEAATGETFVNVWMHNGFVRINEEKMSKSLGNFFTVREVLERYRGEVVRMFILSSHYRSPLNFSDDQLDDAGAALVRLYTALRELDPAQSAETDNEFQQRFIAALDDDFNTPLALSVLFDLVREINRCRPDDHHRAGRLGAQLKQLGNLLGILEDDSESFLKAGASATAQGLADTEVDELVRERLQAREARDWETADRIRDQLSENGIILEDSAGSTSWRRE